MLNIVVSSDFATLTDDPILLNRFIFSQIHKFSHTFILKDCTSWMEFGGPVLLILVLFLL